MRRRSVWRRKEAKRNGTWCSSPWFALGTRSQMKPRQNTRTQTYGLTVQYLDCNHMASHLVFSTWKEKERKETEGEEK